MGVTASLGLLNSLLDPLFGVIEDFWFYKYHSEVYPYFVDALTSEMDLMNFLKIKPHFLKDLESVTLFEEDAKVYSAIAKIHDRAPKVKYFLEVTKDVYTYGFLKALSLFAFINILFMCVKSWKHKEGMKKSVYDFLDRHTMWWNLVIVIIDANLMFTTFSGFVNLLMPGCLNFRHKVNMAILIFYLFVNLIFPFVLFPYIFRKEVKDRGEITLTCAKFTRRGFLLEIMLSCIRNFFRGAIHAFFLSHYEVQITSLMGTDVLLMVACFLLRQGFMNKAMFVVY